MKQIVLACVAALAAVATAQGPALTIRDGDRAITLSMDELTTIPMSKLTTDEKKGDYEGVALIELLQRAGVTLGQSLRGPRLATYLVAAGSDGYRVVVALPEVDPDFSGRPGAIVALRQNGRPLAARDGPLQLILPGDKRHARWVRGLTSLTVHTALEPR